MDLRDLVRALLEDDALAVREWAHEARRRPCELASLALPSGLSQTERALAAGAVEVLAEHWGVAPPEWTREIGPAAEDVWLTRHGRRIPALSERCRRFGPKPLRRRRIFAFPDFLSVA